MIPIFHLQLHLDGRLMSIQLGVLVPLYLGKKAQSLLMVCIHTCTMSVLFPALPWQFDRSKLWYNHLGVTLNYNDQHTKATSVPDATVDMYPSCHDACES